MADGKRTIGMGMDYSPSSKAAARWAVDNLFKAGDRIILVHVIPKNADASHKELWKSTGSPLIPLSEFLEMNVQARYGLVPDKEILEILQAASKAKQMPRKKTMVHRTGGESSHGGDPTSDDDGNFERVDRDKRPQPQVVPERARGRISQQYSRAPGVRGPRRGALGDVAGIEANNMWKC